MWNLKRYTETENRLVDARGLGWGIWVKVVKRYKLPVIREIKSWG